MRDPRTLHRTARLVSLSAALLLVAASVCPLLADDAAVEAEASWVAPPHHSGGHGSHGECHTADCDGATAPAKRSDDSPDLAAPPAAASTENRTLGWMDSRRTATARAPDRYSAAVSPPLTC